jgi:dTDP-4-dehydrorhamnose 3,5-epimerase-like enzyme
MGMLEVGFLILDDSGDDRGSSFTPPYRWLEFLKGLEDLHIAAIRPGHIRGNHFHIVRRELIVVVHGDRWSFHWDAGDATETRRRQFEGSGAVLVSVPPLSSHAVQNDGDSDLLLIAASDERYSPNNPDVVRRVVTGAE